jgi:DNA-binding PucR family transcriptional regulator
VLLRPDVIGMLRSMIATGRLLRALLDEAPNQDVEAAVRACLDAVEELPPGPDKAVAAEEVQQLLELRTLVERYRGRSRELLALFETAGDLSSVRDVEGVLQAIVRRGRQLLSADTAYLMLVDEERGDTYMRVTEGTTGPEFPKIRLPLGVGLGGRVAETMTAHWTVDYLQDDRYLHAIDGIVVEESLVAILGVPLKIGRRLLGVLFAADRSPREFTRDEVSLLASLGDHAAIAIENAALFQEARDAVTALETAKSTIEETNQRLELAVALHEQLTSLVLAGGSVQDLADVLAEVMQGAVLVIDERRRELARATSTTAAPEHADVLNAARDHLKEAEPGERSSRRRESSAAVAVTPVVTEQQTYGALLYVARDITDIDLRSLERAATTMALLLVSRRANDEADNRVRGEILAELLSRSVDDPEAIMRRARLLDVDLTGDLIAVVIGPDQTSGLSTALRNEASRLARVRHGLITALADRIVLLLPGIDPDASAVSVAEQLTRSGFDLTVGSSGPIADLRHVTQHADRAGRAGKVLSALGRTGQGTSADQLGIYGMLLSEAGEDHVRSFIAKTVGELERYDAARGTALMETIRAYFASDGNVAAAAERLYVHPNTMYQRLERLDRLLGRDWRTGERALDLRLALRFRQLLDD